MQLNKSDLFEIDRIMGKKVERNAMYFLVKWKGYPNKENTWEPIENFMDFKFLLKKVEEFDHNTQRISDKHKKVVDYKENMSIEEESPEERDHAGHPRKFVKRASRAKRVHRRRNVPQTERKVHVFSASEEEYTPSLQINEEDHEYPSLAKRRSARKGQVRTILRKNNGRFAKARMSEVKKRVPGGEIDDGFFRRNRRNGFKEGNKNMKKFSAKRSKSGIEEEEITIVRKTNRNWGFDPMIVHFKDKQNN